MGVAVCVIDVSAGMWGVEFVESLADSSVQPYRSDSAVAVPLAHVTAPAFFAGVIVVGLGEYASKLREES